MATWLLNCDSKMCRLDDYHSDEEALASWAIARHKDEVAANDEFVSIKLLTSILVATRSALPNICAQPGRPGRTLAHRLDSR